MREAPPGPLGAAVLAALARPRVAALLLSLLFALLAGRAASLPADDCDVWWLAAAGRDLLNEGTIPRRNLYSYTDPDHPWVLHETLPAIAEAVGLEHVGPAFFTLFGIGAGALGWALVAAALLGGAARPAPAALLGVLVLSAERGALFAPRPAHAALALAVAMAALVFRPRWGRATPPLAVALAVLWANAHGSFPLGPVLIAAAAADQGLDGGERRRRLFAAAVAVLATLLNPYGVSLHGLVAGYLAGGEGTARIIHTYVAEFAPLWEGRAPYVDAHKLAALAMILCLAGSALFRRRHIARALAVLGLLGLATMQVRHVTLAILIGAVLVRPEVETLSESPESRPRSGWWWAATTTLPGLLLAVVLWSGAFARRSEVEWIAEGVGGSDLALLVHALPDGARVYAPFQSAGLVIWLAAPRGVRVFYDSRNDCYSVETAVAAFALEAGAIPPGPILSFHGTDFALAPRDHPIASALAGDPHWEIWRSAGAWTAYRPSSSMRAALPERSRR